MAKERRPNELLGVFLAEADWSGQDLARAVNAAGLEAGVALRYDRSAVSHWLSGMQPRPPAPELVAEALSRRLGRTVTVSDIGMSEAATSGSVRSGEEPDTPGSVTGREEGRAVTELSRLLGLQRQLDAGRRKSLAAGLYSTLALAVPAWPPPGGVSRVGTARGGVWSRELVEAAESMVEMFTTGDAAWGGGHGRRALAGYLAADLGPRLRAVPPAGPLRRRALAAATQLTYLCGFMCFDEELHGLAQRYYRTALDLAAENGDQARYAITLRALSVQAHSLGHHRPAAQLAETAAATGRRFDPVRQAFLFGQLAVAHAADGDRTAALASLTAAERRMDAATSTASTPGMGAYHHASLAHQQAAVRASLGDLDGAIAALTVSIRHRPPGERRSRAITLARLAELHLGRGHLDQAAATWNAFLNDYPGLKSGRAHTALKTLRASLRPYAANPAARATLRHATELARKSTRT